MRRLLGSIVLTLSLLLAPTATAKLLPAFSGERIDDFWLNQSAPGAITEVPDPAGSGATVFKFTVGDRDETGGDSPNPRAELLSPNRISAGDEYWMRGKFLLPRTFPDDVPEWLQLMQGPYGDPASGSPPWSIKVTNDDIVWQRNGTYDYDVAWIMPLVRGKWIEVLVHSRFARHGFVAMWIDGERVTFFKRSSWNPQHEKQTRRLRMQTMDSSNDGGPNSIYLQNYRKRGMYDSVTAFLGPLLIGPTRASVGG